MRWLFFPPFLLLTVFAPAAIAYRFMDPVGRPPFLIYGIRWFLGALFVISGLAKLIPHFPNSMGPTNLEFTLAPHGLAFYARFIAVAEVGTGLLLLTRRFATLGALLLVPMLASIIVITVSLQWQGTPSLVTGFLVLALVLLAYDYPKFAVLIGDRPSPGPDSLKQFRLPLAWAGGLGVVLTGLTAIRVPTNTSPGTWIAIAALILLVVLDWRRSARS
jgi:uncharacterized membrane protein YphA (DoxX/SURF4 family)